MTKQLCYCGIALCACIIQAELLAVSSTGNLHPDSEHLTCILQRETLLRQLETNQLDIDATLEELNVQQETEDQNYEM